MIRTGEPVFVDSGAWIALAMTRDVHHARARATWEELMARGARIHSSIPVVIETFTFLDRNAARDVAEVWRDSLRQLSRWRLLECSARTLSQAWEWLGRRALVRLSLVDATSFVLMARAGIRGAFAFDHHFAQAGFRLLG